MRQGRLLASTRREHVHGYPARAGTIVTAQPDELRGTDATKFWTQREGWCWSFGAIDHCAEDIVGWHVPKVGDRWAASEPIRQGVQQTHGGYAPKIALGLGLRVDHGPQYTAHQFQAGEVLLHRNLRASPEAFLKAVVPYREGLVVAVECMFTWYWLADLCRAEGIAFVLGHALYMKAIHGGKAKNDRIDAHKIAVLLRGGMLPQAYVYPAEMRATRDLLRRRLHFTRKRAELLTHIENTNSQDNLPAFGTKLTYATNRRDVGARFAEPSVHKTIALDLELIAVYDGLLRDLEAFILRTAQGHDANTLYRLRSVPGIGKILSLVILYEIQDITRFARPQELASYARLVKCAKESAGKVRGNGGTKIGNGHLKWAFSEAAVGFLRKNPEGTAYYQRLVRKHGKGKALTVLAHKLARAVYHLWKHDQVFDQDRFLAT
jgi:transposase